jgi:hypothetical protein
VIKTISPWKIPDRKLAICWFYFQLVSFSSFPCRLCKNPGDIDAGSGYNWSSSTGRTREDYQFLSSCSKKIRACCNTSCCGDYIQLNIKFTFSM